MKTKSIIFLFLIIFNLIPYPLPIVKAQEDYYLTSYYSLDVNTYGVENETGTWYKIGSTPYLNTFDNDTSYIQYTGGVQPNHIGYFGYEDIPSNSTTEFLNATFRIWVKSPTFTHLYLYSLRINSTNIQFLSGGMFSATYTLLQHDISDKVENSNDTITFQNLNSTRLLITILNGSLVDGIYTYSHIIVYVRNLITAIVYELWFPILFILGIIGIACLLYGSYYAIDRVSNHDYRDGFMNGFLIIILGIAFVICWLWGSVT